MRVLVIGGDGFLGANLIQHLQRSGHHEVTATALNRKGATSLDALNVKCRVEYGDVLDLEFLWRVLNATEAQWVFHLAAVSIVRIADNNPRRCLMTNIAGAINVLDAAYHAPHCESVVVASSDKAYGDNGGALYQETDELKPQGVYEVSKACEDMIARMYGRTDTGPRVMVTRCANLYGQGDLNWSRLVPNSCRRAVNGLAPEVHKGAWDYQREWLYVEDACRAYEHLAVWGESGQAYNVGSGDTLTAGDMAIKIAAGLQAPLPAASLAELKCGEIPAQALNCDKLKATGFTCKWTLDEGLRDTLNWYRRYVRWAV